MSDYQDIYNLIDEKVNEAYVRGTKDGMGKNYEKHKKEVEEAYQKGYDKGLKDTEAVKGDALKKRYEKGYNKGLEDAWELARKIVADKDGYNYSELEDIFGDTHPERILEKFSAKEALEKVKAWEEKQKQEKAEREAVWHKKDDSEMHNYNCPKCGYLSFNRFPFCPNCGVNLHGKSDEKSDGRE